MSSAEEQHCVCRKDSSKSQVIAVENVQHEEPNESTRLIQGCSEDVYDVSEAVKKDSIPYGLMLAMLVYCLAVGAVAVPKINIILAMLCIKQGSVQHQRSIRPSDICSDATAHAKLSLFIGCGNLISGILCAFSSPRLGKLSDRYGRKPLIAFTSLGMLSGDIVSVVAGSFPKKISVNWIIIEFIIGGLTGAFLTTVALIQSYITDVTRPETRTTCFSLLHACMYIGLAFGPAVGVLLQDIIGKDSMLPIFYVAGTCHVLFMLYVLFGIPESHARTSPGRLTTLKDEQEPVIHVLGCKHYRRNCAPLAILWSPFTETTSLRNLPILAAIDAFSFGVQVGMPTVLILFSESQLRWNHRQASFFFSANNITRAAILAIIIPMATRFMSIPSIASKLFMTGPNEIIKPSHISILIIRVAVALTTLSYIFLATSISRNTILFVVFSLLSTTSAPIPPLSQSAMTQYVPADRIGELFGAVSALHAVSRAVIPALLQFTFSLTLQYAPRALFWGLGACSALAIVATWKLST